MHQQGATTSPAGAEAGAGGVGEQQRQGVAEGPRVAGAGGAEALQTVEVGCLTCACDLNFWPQHHGCQALHPIFVKLVSRLAFVLDPPHYTPPGKSS